MNRNKTNARLVDELPASYVESCLAGNELYGNSFSEAQLIRWYNEESNAYSSLISSSPGEYKYKYHALNEMHGFCHLHALQCSAERILAIGAAYGHELEPLLSKQKFSECEIYILEPADSFQNTSIGNRNPKYISPNPLGHIDVPESSISISTCFGVLHHVPNVEKVLFELYRALTPGGLLFLREPVISMGNWAEPRPRLTPNERGIPIDIFDRFVADCGFDVINRSLCMFSVTNVVMKRTKLGSYNNKFTCSIDRMLSRLPVWSRAYHATSTIEKLRPTSVFYVLRKPSK